MSTDLRKWINSIPSNRTVKALHAALDLALPVNIDTAVTAGTTQTQAGATALRGDCSFHNVTTVATASDGVSLPYPKEGAFHLVKNSASTNAMKVYAATPGTIDSVATATGVTQLAGDAVLYFCMTDGNYLRLGGVQASEAFTYITTTALTVSGTTQLATLNVTGAATLSTTQVSSLVVTGTSQLTGALNVTGASTLTTTQLSSLVVTGTSQLTGALNVTGASTLTTTQLSSLVVTGTSQLSSLRTTNGISAFGAALTTTQIEALSTASVAALSLTTNGATIFETTQFTALMTDLPKISAYLKLIGLST